MENETVTANNPTDANASTTDPATLLATAGNEPGKQTQSSDTQTPPATETPVKENKTPESAAAANVVPEKYEFKAPEGTEFDPEVLETFSGAAKDAGLSQDAAQKVLEKMAPALVARQVDQVKAIHEEWRTAASSDAEFGGDKLQENLGVARKALDTFGTPALRTLLDDTGLGNHPEVIRLLFKAGKAISEDNKFVVGSASNTGAKSPSAVLFDKTAKKG